jgi:CheY-like chemotaxis protein
MGKGLRPISRTLRRVRARLPCWSPSKASAMLKQPKCSTSDEASSPSCSHEASREISRQVATDILIIEDEPLIAMDIEEMVESLGHRVVGTARTRAEAMALFQQDAAAHDPGRHPAGRRQLGHRRRQRDPAAHPMPVIFITAFPERLLTGERPEPAFLVTKPFNPDMVKALISQALFFRQTGKGCGIGLFGLASGNHPCGGTFFIHHLKEIDHAVLGARIPCRRDYRRRPRLRRYRRNFCRHRANLVLHLPGVSCHLAHCGPVQARVMTSVTSSVT